MNIKKPAFISTVIAFIILCILLIGIPIGMANNGDYYRTMSQNDLYFFEKAPEDQFFNYFVKDFGVFQYYNEITKKETIFTSQHLFIRLAMKIDAFFTNGDYSFDIRFLGFLQILLCCFGIYLFVDYLSYQKTFLTGLLIGLICVLAFTDVGYCAYFNSFYAEGFAYTLFIILFSSILLLFQKRYSPYFLYPLILTSALLLIFLKQQYAPIGIILSIVFIFIAFFEPKKWLKRIAYISCFLSALSGILVYVLIPQEFVNINSYHAMTRGILLTSDTPEESLSEFNIYKQYSLLNGETYYTKYPQVDTDTHEFKEEFLSKYNFVSICLYYVKHPDQLNKMLKFAAENAYNPRPTSLGNYLANSGHEKCARFEQHTLWSTAKDMIPNTSAFLLIWCILGVVLGIKNRPQMIVIASMVLIGLSQIGVSIIAAGDADLGKHIFLFSIVFDFVNLIGISYILTKWIASLEKKYRKKHPLPANKNVMQQGV